MYIGFGDVMTIFWEFEHEEQYKNLFVILVISVLRTLWNLHNLSICKTVFILRFLHLYLAVFPTMKLWNIRERGLGYSFCFSYLEILQLAFCENNVWLQFNLDPCIWNHLSIDHKLQINFFLH